MDESESPLVLHQAEAPAPPPAPTELLVQATVHLPGLPVGATALVDPNDPYMATLLAGRLLVAV